MDIGPQINVPTDKGWPTSKNIRDLLARISVVLQPFAQVSTLSNKLLLHLLLYSDKDLPNDVNKYVLKLTLDFIHKIGHFD